MVSANDAAAIAIQLFRLDARLCDQHPLKVARTTNNSSVSGNTLHEATTSLACSSNIQEQDTQHLSHDASVQANLIQQYLSNPFRPGDLPMSLSSPQITRTTSTCSQTDSSDSSSSSSNTVNIAESIAKEHQIPSVVSVVSMAQRQEDSSSSSAQVSKEDVSEDVLKSTPSSKVFPPSEENGDLKFGKPIESKDSLDHLDMSSLNIPDCIMNDLQDINLALMETMKKPLKHIASFQTGNFIIFL